MYVSYNINTNQVMHLSVYALSYKPIDARMQDVCFLLCAYVCIIAQVYNLITFIDKTVLLMFIYVFYIVSSCQFELLTIMSVYFYLQLAKSITEK